MTTPNHARRGAGLLALVLIVAGLLGMDSAPANAATVEHRQAVPGLHGATLEARINPEGVDTECAAEYVSQSAFDASEWAGATRIPCAPAALGAGVEPVAASARIEGLAFSTVYHYRFILTTAGVSHPEGEEKFATFGFESFSFRLLDAEGQPETQAGATPYELVTSVQINRTEVEDIEGEHAGRIAVAGTIKNLLDELPPGLIGDPTAIPSCTTRAAEETKCSGDAQVGQLELLFVGNANLKAVSPLYNTVPPQGKAARFAGFVNAGTDAFIDSTVRTGADYGITSAGMNISGRAPVYDLTVRIWGVPADPTHDVHRFCADGVEGCPSTSPERPFLRMPTSCGGPLTVRALVDAYESPTEYDEAQAVLPPTTGCGQLQFHPTLEVKPTTETAESPTGLHVDLHVPQNEDPNGLATPDLKDAVVKLPPGLTLNPSSANGLDACTPAQIGLTTPVGTTPIHTTAGPAECPDAAKVGTVEVDTPLLDHPLPGSVYVASPYDNPFHSLLAIYIAVNDPVSGVVLKLAGDVEIGADGQLTTSFDENPQLPFEDFKLDFFDGPQAALKTGAVCGEFGTTSSLTPWSAPESRPAATPGSGYKVGNQPGGGNCPTSADQQPNHPGFEAGSESPLAGAYSPFVLRLTREDGTQQFSSLTVTPPAGLLGKLAGVPYCSDAALAGATYKSGKEEQASSSCPSASEVGVVNVGAGAGPSPFYVQGHAYLAGPYKGAPLSLAIITPAVAGPYDLGTVVVRSALEIDPFTSQITVKSDQIPTELKGIPLDVRSIAVKMNRSNFTLNPTSCEAKAVGGSVTTTAGQTADLHNGFQVGSCTNLGFKPRLKISLKGSTNHGGHPGLKAVLTYPQKGAYANIARAQVNLPHSEFIEQSNLNKACTKPVLLEGMCPKTTIYGKVKAWTPLLDKPLQGNVYLVGGFGYKLPALVAELDGQIRVLLKGKVDSGPNGGIRNTFEAVPDAPVEKFALELKGGPRYSLLVNSENLCKKPQKAIERFTAQNGKVLQTKPLIANTCRKKVKKGEKKAKKSHKQHGHDKKG